MKQKSLQLPTRVHGWRRMALLLAALFALSSNGFCQPADWSGSSTPGLRPPSKAHWSIIYHSLENSLAPEREKARGAKLETNALPVKAEYQLDSPLGKAVISLTGGGEKVIYLVNDVMFTRSAGSDRILAGIIGPFSDPDGSFGQNYPGFSWISRKNYDGIVEFEGKKFYHFKVTAIPQKSSEEGGAMEHDLPLVAEDSEAWVDFETRRPYQFRRGKLIGIYQNEPPLETPITLTPEFKKAFRIYCGYSD